MEFFKVTGKENPKIYSFPVWPCQAFWKYNERKYPIYRTKQRDKEFRDKFSKTWKGLGKN